MYQEIFDHNKCSVWETQDSLSPAGSGLAHLILNVDQNLTPSQLQLTPLTWPAAWHWLQLTSRQSTRGGKELNHQQRLSEWGRPQWGSPNVRQRVRETPAYGLSRGANVELTKLAVSPRTQVPALTECLRFYMPATDDLRSADALTPARYAWITCTADRHHVWSRNNCLQPSWHPPVQ